MKFLIVEDDNDIACFISTTLEIEGWASDIAESAEIAHNLYVRNDYDALIVDAILPGASGVSLVRELREISPDVPVMFCTGANGEFNKKLMWSLGMVCHKPLDGSFPMVVRQFVRSFA